MDYVEMFYPLKMTVITWLIGLIVWYDHDKCFSYAVSLIRNPDLQSAYDLHKLPSSILV